MTKESILDYPLPVFRFLVSFTKSTGKSSTKGDDKPLCGGEFSECTGLEATMEPKAIKVGGQNYGEIQSRYDMLALYIRQALSALSLQRQHDKSI